MSEMDPRLKELMPDLNEAVIANIDAMVAVAEKEAVKLGCDQPGKAYELVYERLTRLFQLLETDGLDVEHLAQARAGASLLIYHLRMSNRLEDALRRGDDTEELMKLEFCRWLLVAESLVGFAINSSFKAFNKRRG